jgi:hypothetical protein
MGQLKKEIESNALEGERLVSRLYDMYTGIDRLQSSLSGLRLGFGESQKDLKFKREMLDKAANVVEERLKITSTVLKLEGNQPATPRADWGAEEKHTGESPWNLKCSHSNQGSQIRSKISSSQKYQDAEMKPTLLLVKLCGYGNRTDV